MTAKKQSRAAVQAVCPAVKFGAILSRNLLHSISTACVTATSWNRRWSIEKEPLRPTLFSFPAIRPGAEYHAQMVEVTISGDLAVFQVEGLDKLWALRSSLE